MIVESLQRDGSREYYPIGELLFSRKECRVVVKDSPIGLSPGIRLNRLESTNRHKAKPPERTWAISRNSET